MAGAREDFAKRHRGDGNSLRSGIVEFCTVPQASYTAKDIARLLGRPVTSSRRLIAEACRRRYLFPYQRANSKTFHFQRKHVAKMIEELLPIGHLFDILAPLVDSGVDEVCLPIQWAHSFAVEARERPERFKQMKDAIKSTFLGRTVDPWAVKPNLSIGCESNPCLPVVFDEEDEEDEN